MPDFSAKMHQIQFRLGLRPTPQWGSPLAGWVGLVATAPRTHTHPLSAQFGPRYSLFPRPTILAPKPKSQTAYVPKDATLSSPELVPPLFRPKLRPCSRNPCRIRHFRFNIMSLFLHHFRKSHKGIHESCYRYWNYS